MKDIGGMYRAGRRRITHLVRDLTAEECATRVPACPEWTVHDVVAHLAGACTDALAGNLDGVTTAAWANAQADARRDRTIAELLDEWSTAAPPLEAAPERLPEWLPTIWILDLTAHEHDLRGALARPGARDAPALPVALEYMVNAGLHRQLVARDTGRLEVRTPAGRWVVGPGTQPPVATVEASTFDLFRALTGRRSPAQIARFRWTGDAHAFIPAFQFGTFTTRTTDLDE